MVAYISRVVRREDGVTAIEYAFIASLIAVVIVGVVAFIGTQLQGTFQTVADSL